MYRHLLAILATLSGAAGTYVGVDIGNSTFKAALIQTGKKPVMLINPQSKRTTPSSLMIHKPPRLIGSPATALASKFPTELVELAHSLAGVHCRDHVLPWDKEMVPYEINCDQIADRYTIVVRNGKMKLWPEDVIVHFLDYIKQLASSQIREQSSSETVANAAIRKMEFKISLPVGFTYRQQLAYTNAAKIAGVKLVSNFDSQIAAAAAYHSADLSLEEGASVTKLIIDIGALNVQACLVKFMKPSQGAIKSLAVRTFVDQCHGTTLAGGLQSDWILARWAMKHYEDKHGRIKGTKREKAMQRVIAEANKKKHVLSANKTTKMVIENLDGEGHHMDVAISRAEFEALLEEQGIFKSIIDLVTKFDNDEDHPLTERVSAVEWIGNGWRVPSIQERLQSSFKDLTFQTTINADESPALGTLYLAANDPKYKTPTVYLEDAHNVNLLMNVTERDLRVSTELMEQLKQEDKYREQLELARNDFEDYIYKAHQLMTNEDKIAPIIEQEAAMLAEQEASKENESTGWLGSILGKGKTDTDNVDGEEEVPESSEPVAPVMTIAERIPKALELVAEAQEWMDQIKDDTFDKSKSLVYRDELRTLIEPLLKKIKEDKAKKASERKAKMEEKKAAQAAEKEAQAKQSETVEPSEPVEEEEL